MWQSFNKADTILVISKYPYQDVGASFHGVAVYTRDTLEAIAKRTKQKFVVLVERAYGRQVEVTANGSILVVPCFDIHPVGVFSELWTALRQFDRVRNIQLHSEFYNSGNLLQMSLLLPFLYLLRLQGKIVSFINHNVVHDFSFLSNHLGKAKADWRLSLLSQVIPWYYRFLSLGVEQFITLDESIRQRLASYLWDEHKVKATSIWLRNQSSSRALRARTRRQLGIKDDEIVLAVFGFMSRYKGVDFLLKHFLRFKREFPKSRFKLILAGGMAPSQQGQRHYQQFYAKLEKLARQHQDVTLTGFIPASEMKKYMAVTDAVLLPYRGILGASASWASVLGYGKACFFSRSLAPYFMADDVRQTLSELQIDQEDLIFEENYQALRSLFLSLEQDRVLLKRATRFSKHLANLRSEDVCIFRDFPPLYFPRACYTMSDAKVAA